MSLKEIRENHERWGKREGIVPLFSCRDNNWETCRELKGFHQDRAELLKLVEEFKSIVSDIAGCNCDRCGANKECNFLDRYNVFLSKLD